VDDIDVLTGDDAMRVNRSMQDMDLPMEAMSDSQSRDVPDVDVLVPPAMLPLLRTTNPSHLQGSTLSRCSSIALDYLHMMSSFTGGTQHK
jgi:hypothetical protein